MQAPEELKAFTGAAGEWRYVAEQSDDDTYVFARGKPTPPPKAPKAAAAAAPAAAAKKRGTGEEAGPSAKPKRGRAS